MGDEGESAEMTSGGGVMPPPGELALEVHDVSVLKTRDDDTSPWSRTVVYMSVTLANGQGGAAVPTNYALFTVETDSGVRKQADADAIIAQDDVVYESSSFVVGSACDPTLSITGGASLTCTLAASFDGDFSPSRLIYMTPGALAESQGVSASDDKRTASAALGSRTCTDCGTLCTDVEVDARHCGRCASPAPQDGACLGGVPTCPSELPDLCRDSRDSFCTDLNHDDENCGRCGNDISDAHVGPEPFQCVSGQPRCEDGLTRCESEGSSLGYCSDLASDPENCGACGNFLEAGQCVNGMISCFGDEQACDNECVDRLDRLHCGRCNRRCDREEDDRCLDVFPELNGGETEFCSGSVLVSSDNDPCNPACVAAGYEGCVVIDSGFGPGCYRPGAVVVCACRY